MLGKIQVLFHLLLTRRLHLSQLRWLSLIHQQETTKKKNLRRTKAAERRGGMRRRNTRRKKNVRSMIGTRNTIIVILTRRNIRKTRSAEDSSNPD